MDKRKIPASGNGVQEKKAKQDEVDPFQYLKKPQDPQPDVYIKPPTQPLVKKDGQLTDKQLAQYFDKGFLLLHDLMSIKKLDAAREAINKLVDDIANRLYKAGKIKNKHEDKTFFNRLTHLEKEFKGTAIMMHKAGTLPKEFQDIWADDKLLNIIEQLIGPDIAGHPVWNLRSKTPHNEQLTVPWHQDNAYLEPCSLETLQVTAWIPLIDANLTNGCMQVASGGHRKGVTLKHTCCAGGTWYVEMDPKEMPNKLGVDLEKDIVTCEVPYGSILLLNNSIPHQSLENRSDIIRWSLDLRWQRPDKENGFYGIKKSVLMRKSKDPDYKIDWSEMAGIDRTTEQMKMLNEHDDTEDFDTEICGPWMKRWDIVHHNRHTEMMDLNPQLPTNIKL